MPIFKFLANAFTNRRFSNLSQEQNEALIDTLAAAKVIDGELHPAEAEELLDSMRVLNWEGAWDLEQYISRAVQKAQTMEVSEEPLLAFFGDISARLGERWLREEAYYLASRIALADRVVVEEERRFLKYMVQAFEVGNDIQQLIIRKVTSELEMD